MGSFDDLSTGSTWSWLPGAVAAAMATLDAYETEDVLGNVAELEAVAGRRRAEIKASCERIGDVEAVGCFQAIEFVKDRETRERDTDLQHAVAAEMCRRGVLADSSTTSLNIQPSLPPPSRPPTTSSPPRSRPSRDPPRGGLRGRARRARRCRCDEDHAA